MYCCPYPASGVTTTSLATGLSSELLKRFLQLKLQNSKAKISIVIGTLSSCAFFCNVHLYLYRFCDNWHSKFYDEWCWCSISFRFQYYPLIFYMGNIYCMCFIMMIIIGSMVALNSWCHSLNFAKCFFNVWNSLNY